MTGMDSRIAKRRAQVRQARMRRRRRRTLIGVLIALLVAAGVAIERSPLVELAEIEVAGAERLTIDEVRAAAALPLGTSTLRLDLAAADRRVEELPWVRSADIRRRDPLTVRITIQERRPVMTVTAGGRSVLVDADGTVPGHGNDDRLPVLALSGGHLPQPGESLRDRPAAWNALAVYTGLPGPLRPQIARVEATGADEAELVLRSGTRVRFGRADRLDEKARTLGALLGELETPAQTIDVRAPSNPVVVPG